MAFGQLCESATIVRAPFSGVLRPLAMVDDAAFAQEMLGQGIAIDPLDSIVTAPFDGEVVDVASTGHSLTLRSAHGAEVLIHIGLDTVALQHAGFAVRVRRGQQVRRGEQLLQFDLDLIARLARDCISPIIVISQGAQVETLRGFGPVAAGEDILRVTLGQSTAPESRDIAEAIAHQMVIIGLPHGIHARPAGRIARFVKVQSASITLSFAGKDADCASVTQLMRLGVSKGDEVTITANGPNAGAMLPQLKQLLERMADEESGAFVVSSASDTICADTPAGDGALTPTQLPGVIASAGIGIGPVAFLGAGDPEVPEHCQDPSHESIVLDQAIAALSQHIRQSVDSNVGLAREIASAHLAILKDTVLFDAVKNCISEGLNASAAWRKASRSQEADLLSSGNARLRERAIDLRDVERRIIHQILGTSPNRSAALIPSGSVLVCDDVAPSILIENPDIELAAICCSGGGVTSHAALLAAAAGIPMLVSLGTKILEIEPSQTVIVDGEAGLIDVAPSKAALAQARCAMASLAAARDHALARAASDCRLADGTRIEVFANLGSEKDAAMAVNCGAEGCGLLRSEFVFADRATLPSEAEQIAAYRAIAGALDGRPLIVRLLDVGADKPLTYFPFPAEDNPALGMRGVRFLIEEQTFLQAQLKALLIAVPPDQLQIMIPMLVDLRELRIVRDLLDKTASALGIVSKIQLGVMIETPAAAMLSDQLAAEADFLSIGSNDLTQYMLAMDRGNSALAPFVDSYHPAVLRMIAEITKGSANSGRWLGICGGLASEPDAAPLLVGLGCNELSAVPRSVPAIKHSLSAWTMQECKRLAASAVALASPQEVRDLLVEARK